MNHAAKCKICKTPIVISFDAEYEGLGDPFKLMLLATCNRCYDLRNRRETIHAGFAVACGALACLRTPIADKHRAALALTVEALTKQYANYVSDFYRRQELVWDSDFTAMVIENPAKWPVILRNYRESYRKQYGQQEMSV